jgi:hypothetical protein
MFCLMEAQNYSYQESSRRPIVFFVLALSLGFFVAAKKSGTPWYVSAPAIVSVLMCTWAIIANRVSGSQLDDETLSLFSGKWQRRLSVDEIDAIHVTEWSEGAPTLLLVTKDQEKLSIPSVCIGSSKKFLAACVEHGFKTVQKN